MVYALNGHLFSVGKIIENAVENSVGHYFVHAGKQDHILMIVPLGKRITKSELLSEVVFEAFEAQVILSQGVPRSGCRSEHGDAELLARALRAAPFELVDGLEHIGVAEERVLNGRVVVEGREYVWDREYVRGLLGEGAA